MTKQKFIPIYLFSGCETTGGSILFTRLAIHAEVPIFSSALSVSVFILQLLEIFLQKGKLAHLL